MVDVFFYEAFSEEAEELRRLLPAGISAEYTDRTIQETGHEQPPARLISVRTQSRLPVEWAPSLDAILSRSTGYDHLLSYSRKAQTPIALGYLPLYCHRAVAEQALMLWMALLRKLRLQLRQFAHFHRDGLTGTECQGQTLAVVGVGNIGREICLIGKGLGMRVLGVDLQRLYDDIEYADPDQAIAQADVLVCAMDLNDNNRGYFHIERLRGIKPGAVFVNVSRGELSPARDLLKALEEGLLSGVGLDVYDHEAELAVTLRGGGHDTHDPEVLATLALFRRDDVLCTPHNAFNTIQAVERKSDHSVQQIVEFLKTGKFLWPVPTR